MIAYILLALVAVALYKFIVKPLLKIYMYKLKYNNI